MGKAVLQHFSATSNDSARSAYAYSNHSSDKRFRESVGDIGDFCDFFIADLQVLDFCRQSFSRDFIDHVPDPFKRCSTVYRENKVFP